MRLADRVDAHRARPANAVERSAPVSMEAFAELIAGRHGGRSTKAGVAMGPMRALGITAWYSGVRYLAEGVSTLPAAAYRDFPGGERSRRATPPWLARPDAETPWAALVEHWLVSLLHRGNAFAFKLRDESNRVVGLRALRPDRVTVGQAPDGTKRFLVDRDRTEHTTRDVLHIPGLSYDGVVGLNPIHALADALGAVAAADDYAGRFYGQGTHMGGLLSFPQELTREQREVAEEEWQRFHEGLANAHQTGVLSHGATYAKLSLDAKDAQLLEARGWGVYEVARILRIPPHKLYELTRSTNNNIEHQSIESVTDSIRPWVERIETWVNFDPDLLAAGTFLEFDVEHLMRGDVKSQYEAWAAGITAGFLMPSEPRRKLSLPHVPGSDYLAMPLNMARIGPDAAADEAPGADRVNAAGILIRSGFRPDAVLKALRLPAIDHTGLLPVTLQADDDDPAETADADADDTD